MSRNFEYQLTSVLNYVIDTVLRSVLKKKRIVYYFDIIDSLHGVLIAADVNVFLAVEGSLTFSFSCQKV